MLPAYEKLGALYLGRSVADGEAFLYPANDLLTHGVIVGMTGSGKTGLAIALLEEAAIDGIPAIVIDPKGDLANLLLAFPELDEASFAAWAPDGKSGADEARAWREGLAAWEQDTSRVARLCASRDVTVYTPGSDAGVPIAMLGGLSAPSPALREDAEAFAARIGATVSGLLGWLSIEAEPGRSREHLLLSAIVERAWSKGEDIDLPRLVKRVQEPGIRELGVLDLEAVYPKKERFELAVALNALIASPTFAAWQRGVPLDIGALLFSPDGKPRTSVLSIAHLADAERMFVVTLVLHAMIAWMRSQPGTQSLRALLYMDEIAGSMPPVANPPSKAPWLLLMKQARAFGLGVVVATQNPVDLDYKALSNAGTWFLGRLQTERDKLRVLDGLEGALAGSISREELDRSLSGLGKRKFLVHDVHAGAPRVIETRWAMSYLRGPLTKDELRRAQVGTKAAALASTPPAPVTASDLATHVDKPTLPAGIAEVFLPTSAASPTLRAVALGAAKIRFADKKLGIDVTREVLFRANMTDAAIPVRWDDGKWVAATSRDLLAAPPASATYAPLPRVAQTLAPKTMNAWQAAFVVWLEANQGMPCLRAPAIGETAQPGESEPAFRARVANRLREARDAKVAALREKYAARFETLKKKLATAEDALARETAESRAQGADTALSVGAGVLGAFLGKGGAASIARSAATAARSAARAQKQASDVTRAEERIAGHRDAWQELEHAFQDDAAAIAAEHAPESVAVESVVLRPAKRDITVEWFGVGWVAD